MLKRIVEIKSDRNIESPVNCRVCAILSVSGFQHAISGHRNMSRSWPRRIGFMAPAIMRRHYEADPHIVELSRESRVEIHGSSRKLELPVVRALIRG